MENNLEIEEVETIKSLDEKLMELKKIVSIMQKNKEGHGYSYVDEESILLALNDKMIELGLKLTPRFKDKSLHSEIVQYVNTKGQQKTDILVRAEMQFIWKDIYTKEIEINDWALLGQQADASQSLGSGLTYSSRYFLLKYFNVATSKDDPDTLRSQMLEEEEKKKMTATQTKVKKLFAKIVTILGSGELVYQKLGTTKEQFLKDYNDKENCKSLEEQIELLLKVGNE